MTEWQLRGILEVVIEFFLSKIILKISILKKNLVENPLSWQNTIVWKVFFFIFMEIEWYSLEPALFVLVYQ